MRQQLGRARSVEGERVADHEDVTGGHPTSLPPPADRPEPGIAAPLREPDTPSFIFLNGTLAIHPNGYVSGVQPMG
jgi:hypothetical protein